MQNEYFKDDPINDGWMKLDIRNIRTRYINVKEDTKRSEQMISLLEEHGFKDYERFDALTSPPEDILHLSLDTEDKFYSTHMCGLSHRKLLQETIVADDNPILILEDDVNIENMKYEISIPKNSDCIYFGTSHGDYNYSAINIGNDWLKVDRIFTTHAILHLTPRYSAAARSITEFCVLTGMPFDSFGLAYQLQGHFNVYAPRLPFFYQAKEKQNNSLYDVEALTRPRLLTDNEKIIRQAPSGPMGA